MQTVMQMLSETEKQKVPKMTFSHVLIDVTRVLFAYATEASFKSCNIYCNTFGMLVSLLTIALYKQVKSSYQWVHWVHFL